MLVWVETPGPPAGGKLSVGPGTPELGVVRYRGRDLQGDKVILCESWAIGSNPPSPPP